MKFFLALILMTAAMPAFADSDGSTFEVKGSAIAPDEYTAKMNAGNAAKNEATRRCKARGHSDSRMIGEGKDCVENYSVHGQSETCTFTFVCK